MENDAPKLCIRFDAINGRFMKCEHFSTIEWMLIMKLKFKLLFARRDDPRDAVVMRAGCAVKTLADLPSDRYQSLPLDIGQWAPMRAVLRYH